MQYYKFILFVETRETENKQESVERVVSFHLDDVYWYTLLLSSSTTVEGTLKTFTPQT